MITSNNKISVVVEEQIPAFIREDHDKFVQFIKSYYEFMELNNPPIDIPLVIDNPNLITYNTNNPYGAGSFLVGETIEQKANLRNPTEVTGKATVFSFSSNTISKIVTVTAVDGTQSIFVKGFEILGKKSGVKYFPSKNIQELSPGPTQASHNAKNLKNIDTTLEDYLEFIRKEVAVNFPTSLTLNADKRVALKNLRDFYRARGTENSFKLLFKLVYNEDVNLYFPETDMLRASVGSWNKRQIIRTTIPQYDAISGRSISLSDIVGKEIIGIQSGATAIVESAQELIYSGLRFAELDLSRKIGTFYKDEIVKATYLSADNIEFNIEIKTLGLVTNITVVDGGSNYAVGDRLEISGGNGTGALAEVATVNASSGAITSINILDPGYQYNSIPSIGIKLPHGGDAGNLRFNTGTLETIFYETFDQLYANALFSESDNRGTKSNVASIGSKESIYSIKSGMITNPAHTTANSYGNFVTIPNIESGLKGWWPLTNYHTSSVRINTLDGTFGDGNDPGANTSVIGPRVKDSLFLSDPTKPPFGYSDRDVLKNRLGYVNDPAVTNTYSASGWTGFKPVIFDQSGHGHHAWLKTLSVLSGGPYHANVFTSKAFSDTGIYGLTSNSWTTGSEYRNYTDVGGLVLRSHDDIRNANTQTWTFWYYPHIEVGKFSGTFQNDTAWSTQPSTSATYSANNIPNIISRDRRSFWALSANISSTSVVAGSYIDCLFAFTGGTLDNGTSLTDLGGPGRAIQIANTSGYHPGVASGILNAGGGVLRAQTWNMIALTIDYNSRVGNIYFFNTVDGLHCSNGFSISPQQSSNTTIHANNVGGWVPVDGRLEGRAVVLGAASASANGDSNRLDENPATASHGRFNEVRYYDRALSHQEVIKLFKNPGGRFNKTLSGNWAITNYNSRFSNTNPMVGMYHNSTIDSNVLRIGSNDSVYANGVQLVLNQNIPFNPEYHYKMTIKARNFDSNNTSNVDIGIIGISNTGTSLIGYDGSDNWAKQLPIVKSSTAAVPAGSGTLGGTTWTEYSAVFGGNASSSGWSSSISLYQGTGGNTLQSGTNFTWRNPAKLFGSIAAATQQGAGNTSYFRPVLAFKDWNQGNFIELDYVKIEVSKEARFVAEIGGDFEWPGQSTSDAGKLSTSATRGWLSKYLSDNNYYQTYSYVIRSGLSIATYKNIVDKLVHVAGKKLFGKVRIETFIQSRVSGFQEIVSAGVVDLLRRYYLGAESSMFDDYASVPLGNIGTYFKSNFGLKESSLRAFDLNAAHGDHDIDYGNGPGWIVWDQSPTDNPYAKSNYSWNTYTGPYARSNSYSTVTKDKLIYHINGNGSKLVTGWANNTSKALDGQAHYANTPGYGQNGIYQHNTKFGMPLDIDGGRYRYVRMKVRRVGPGGYGTNSWDGSCQCEINPNANASFVNPASYTSAGANTISQPSTLMLPSTAANNDTSPWHILEWDMWNLGTYSALNLPNFPTYDKSKAWAAANSVSGTSPRLNGSGRRVGWIGLSLSKQPDNSREKFEIDWIQIDNGTGWPRGSYVWPMGYAATSSTLQLNSGTNSYGNPNKIRIAASADSESHYASDFSVSVETAAKSAQVKFKNAPVIYTHSDYSIKYDLPLPGVPSEYSASSNGAIFRVSGNSANTSDWVVTEIIDSLTVLTGLGYFQTNTYFDGPVSIVTDKNDNLFIAYVYGETGIYPGFNSVDIDNRPIILIRATPTTNAQTSTTTKADGHNLYSTGSVGRGRSTTYRYKLILFGGASDNDQIRVLAKGPTELGKGNVYGDFNDESVRSTIDMYMGEDSSLMVLGGGSQNIVKIVPSSVGTYGGDDMILSSTSSSSWDTFIWDFDNWG